MSTGGVVEVVHLCVLFGFKVKIIIHSVLFFSGVVISVVVFLLSFFFKMRFGSMFFLVFLILVEILVLIRFEPVESFVTIPAPVAFAIITAAVKLKLILVKIMFALRTLGKYHLIRKREASSEFNITTGQNELLAAWNELEREAERQIHFDLESCIEAATANTTATVQREQIDDDLTTVAPTEIIETEVSEGEEYAKLISSLVGRMTKSDHACQVLQEGLISTGREEVEHS